MEVINALKAPFTTLPADSQPRPVVVAVTWAAVGFLLSRI